MSACLIDGADEKTDTERSLSGMIGLDLRLFGDLGNQSLSGVMRVMSVPIVQAFSSHKLAEISGISSETSDGDAHMIIDVEDLLLMTSEVMRALLQ